MATISFKCPNCDGDLRFHPDTQKYQCEFCRSVFTEAELEELTPAQNEEKIVEEKEVAKEEQGVFYHCPSCGAEIVTDSTTAATFCYYCHNPVVLGGRLAGEYLPDEIIPFQLSKEKAIELFLQQVSRKKYIPKAFFEKKQMETMTGVYFPFWMLHGSEEGSVSGEGKKVRRWIVGREEFIETKVYRISREGVAELSHFMKNALKKANRDLVEGVLPYDFSKMKKFSMGYLSGFFAEKRDLEQQDVSTEMEGELKKYASQIFRDQVKGYDQLSWHSSNMKLIKKEYRYVLLPVWTMTWKGRDGKMYYFSMNGQTGKVCGDYPVDQRKLLFSSIVVGLFVAIVLFIGGMILC